MVRPSSCLLVCSVLATLLLVPTTAYPSPGSYPRDGYESEELVDLLGRLGSLLQIERKMDTFKDDITNDKRGLDLGLSRGYSGALQAKHLMGLAAANFAGGPGRRRRDVSQ